MRILACADIHLGRKPELAQSGHAAWDAIIQKALELAVDVVVLAGDVVEHERNMAIRLWSSPLRVGNAQECRNPSNRGRGKP